jgi:hypothetical protein
MCLPSRRVLDLTINKVGVTLEAAVRSGGDGRLWMWCGKVRGGRRVWRWHPQEPGKDGDDPFSSSIKRLRSLLDSPPTCLSPKYLLGDLKDCVVKPGKWPRPKISMIVCSR